MFQYNILKFNILLFENKKNLNEAVRKSDEEEKMIFQKNS